MPNQGVIEVTGLPDAPMDAAAHFHADFVPRARSMMVDGDVAVIFPAADHTHSAWRLAAIQELAREAAPFRVNGIAGDDAQDISETLFYLQSAGGVTGQILAMDGNPAQVD